MSTEQLASTLKQRLHVTDGILPPPPGENALAPTTTTTTTSTTASAPLPLPASIPSTPAPQRATNLLLRSKFEYWQACMLSLLTSNECDYEFARRANDCSNRALNDWETHFRNQFMSNADNCSIILDPRYKGECLGVNISFLLFADLASWAPYFWRDSVLARIGALQSEIIEFARRMLEAQAKVVEAKYNSPADSAVRMQQHTLIQYCHVAMEKSITSKFVALFDALKIDVSSLISSICSEYLVSRLLNKASEVRGLKSYHKLLVDGIRVLPFDVAGAIKARFTEIIKSAILFLDPIEQHMDQLLLNLASSQNQLKNMDPAVRQHLQQRMFANMRFGNRGVRPAPKPQPVARDDIMTDAHNEDDTNVTNNSNRNSYNSASSGSSATTSPNNSFNNSFNNNSFHNNTISNKTNFSAVLPVRTKSTLPVPPYSPPSLSTLCIHTICKHITKIHALQSGLLPEELIHRIIACLISDEMSVYIKQLDSSILGKLLDSSLSFLDFENAASLYPSSCMVIASRCTSLRRLNLSHCINIDDESLHHIASSLKFVESLSLGGCYQVGDAGVVAVARGFPNLCNINLSSCTRITDVSVQNLLSVTTLQSLVLRNCTQITDEAFQCISDRNGAQLLQIDLSECRAISDRTLHKIGQFSHQLRILNLSGKGITDEGIKSVVDGCSEMMELELVACEALTNTGIQHCFKLAQLRVFSLSTARAITDVAFTIPESDSMSDITDAPTTCWPNLQSLTLSKCPNLSGKSTSFFARQCSQLASIDFSFTQMNDASLVELAAACPLIDVDLSSCKDITDTAILEIARKCSLRKLNIASCVNISDISLVAVSQNPGLQHLDLTSCERITDEGVVKVAQGCPELRSISLAECAITDASVLALGAAVDGQGSGCYNLETVRLAFCAQIGDEALHRLARGCPNIRTLDLSNCSNKITPVGMRVALRALTKLQTLRLKGFHLSTESIIDGVHPSLKVLNLSWCSNIEDAALVAVSTACPALEQCDITRCTKITNDAVRKLAENCSNLRQLNLTGCKDVTQNLVNMLVKIGKLIKN